VEIVAWTIEIVPHHNKALRVVLALNNAVWFALIHHRPLARSFESDDAGVLEHAVLLSHTWWKVSTREMRSGHYYYFGRDLRASELLVPFDVRVSCLRNARSVEHWNAAITMDVGAAEIDTEVVSGQTIQTTTLCFW